MDWQRSADTTPSRFITEEQARSVLGKPPVSGAWRDGDPAGERRFAELGPVTLETGGFLPHVRVAYESWGTLDDAGGNAILIAHALTGDSHVRGESGRGHRTAGWWEEIVGPGLALDTERYFVVCANVLGGCQGTTGPASFAPDGAEWGARFPHTTVRDQSRVLRMLADALGIQRFHTVVGGSMGGMHALEFAATWPERVDRLAILASTASTTADQIAANMLQSEAIRTDPSFAEGAYYDEAEGPHRGLALARRIALLSYRSADELNERFDRTPQSSVSPLGDGGRFAVESYLDFHGNRFTRRFDANSYLTLVAAMDSHDLGRGRGGVEAALGTITATTAVLGITSDRLFPLADQQRIAAGIPGLLPDGLLELDSPYGHDAFLIETEAVATLLRRLLDAPAAAEAAVPGRAGRPA